MTREEQIKQEIYIQLAGCGGEYSEGYEQGFIQGAKWADKTMIDKACEWLQCIDFEVDYFTNDNDGYTFFNADKFIEDFCKKMEE